MLKFTWDQSKKIFVVFENFKNNKCLKKDFLLFYNTQLLSRESIKIKIVLLFPKNIFKN